MAGMSKSRAEKWLTPIVLAIGLPVVVVAGVLYYMSVTAVPLHPNPHDVTSVIQSPPLPRWTSAVEQARQYVRSRHFQQYIDGKWQEDPRSDLGRIDRQQKFILDAVSKAQGFLGEDLLHLNSVLPAARQALTVDPGLDILSLAKRFRSLTKNDIVSYSLPVKGKTVGGKSVLVLEEDQAEPILDFFRGNGPPPPVATTTPST